LDNDKIYEICGLEKLVVIIIGTNEEAQTATEYLLEQEAVIYGYLSENENNEVTEILDIPVLGYYEDKTYLDLLKKPEIQYFIAVKEASKRQKVSEKIFKVCKKHPISVIHPTSYIAGSASLANGILVGPFCNISEKVSIEADTFIGSHVSIGRNTKIDRGCDIHSGVKIGSNVIIEKNVYIGLNATLHHGIRIEEKAVVLSGSVLFQTIKKGSSVMGIPAQIYKQEV
jgi:sugar O-acyltransferase (sialic acid O-acetyltransferase NeuD family)